MEWDLFLSIFIGLISSFIFWYILNIWLTPKLEIKDLQYDEKGNPCVKVYNASRLLKAYEVVCYINYYNEKGKLKFMRNDKVMPVLTCFNNKGSEYRVKLTKCKVTNLFWKENPSGSIKIIVTGQNRFGVKRMFSKDFPLPEEE